MSRSKLLLSVELFRAMASKKVVGADLRGRIIISTKAKDLLEEIDDRGMTLDCAHSGVANGAEVDVELALPRGQTAFFAETWQQLLDSHNFRFAAPTEYFVATDDFYSAENIQSVSSRRYLSILSLIAVLKEASDYVDTSVDSQKFVFVASSKFELPVRYQFVSFRDTPGIDELSKDFSSVSTTHRDQRKVILKVVLVEMLANVAPEARFKELLEQFSDFIRRFKEGYELYVAEFSFEKVLAEVETHKLDYTLKLNKVFSDIQSQLLAVPAALILVGSQLSDKGGLDWKNVIVLVGVLTYTVLMDLLIRNQYNSLLAISVEMKKEKEHLVKRHAALKHNFDEAYTALETRYRQQRRLIKTVDFLVALMLSFSAVLFILYSTPQNTQLKMGFERLFLEWLS